MARNLVLFDPSEGEWCVFAHVGTIGDVAIKFIAG